MFAGAGESKGKFIAVNPINEQSIFFNMQFTEALPISCQRVVLVNSSKFTLASVN